MPVSRRYSLITAVRSPLSCSKLIYASQRGELSQAVPTLCTPSSYSLGGGRGVCKDICKLEIPDTHTHTHTHTCTLIDSYTHTHTHTVSNNVERKGDV